MSFFREKISPHHSRFLFAKTHKIWWKNHGICVKNAICVSSGTIWGKTNFWKEQKFSSISYFARENFELSANKSQQVFQDCITRVQMNVSRTFFLKKKHIFFAASRLWANNHETFWGKKSACSSKLHFTSAARRLEILFGKSSFLFITFGLYPQKNIELLAVQLQHARQNAVWVTRGTFWKKTPFLKFFFTYICPSWSFSDFQPFFFENRSKNFSAQFSGLHFTCPGEKFEQNRFFFEKIYTFYQFSTFSEKSLDFWLKNFGGVVRIDFYVSRGTIEEFFEKSYTFSHHFRNVSETKYQIFGGKTSAGLSKLHLTSPVERFEGFLEKKLNFYHFWILSANIYPTSGGKYAACLSKTQSGCPREHFEENTFLKKKCIHVLTDCFWIPANFFQNFRKNVSARLIKLHFTCPGEEFEQKRFFCKSSFFIHFGNFRIEKFEMFAEKVPQGRQDCVLCDQMKVLRSFFSEMKRKFFWFSDVEQKSFGLLAKVSSRLVKTVIYVSTKTFRWLFFWKNYISFHRFPTLTAESYQFFCGNF